MPATYLLFFLTLSAFAQTSPQIQVLPTPKSMNDFNHQFKGCPENSECDQIMGHMMDRWKDLITKLQANKLPPVKTAQMLELFRAKYGIPTDFYTTQKNLETLKPVLYNSACTEHNPKPPGEKILRGTAFFKGLSPESAFGFRDQAQVEVPLKGNIIVQPVKVYYESGVVSYQLPLNDQPLFIKNKELYLLKEEDSFYFMLKVNHQGAWKIEHVDFTQLSKWEDHRQNISCPVDKELPPGAFKVEFCKTVWNMDSSKVEVVKMEQGCPI